MSAQGRRGGRGRRIDPIDDRAADDEVDLAALVASVDDDRPDGDRPDGDRPDGDEGAGS